MFLVIGYNLDRQIGPYMDITPLHLVPSTVVISSSIVYALILKRRAARAEAAAELVLVADAAMVASRQP
jgi:hypothetical protein